jgi:hypothetical protein
MTEGSGIETYANGANTEPASEQGAPPTPRDWGLKRTLVFVAIVAASAGLAFAIVRATLARPPSDPTTERESSS